MPWNRLLVDGIEAGFTQRTLERAREKARLQRIPPAKVHDHIGERAYVDLEDDEYAACGGSPCLSSFRRRTNGVRDG